MKLLPAWERILEHAAGDSANRSLSLMGLQSPWATSPQKASPKVLELRLGSSSSNDRSDPEKVDSESITGWRNCWISKLHRKVWIVWGGRQGDEVRLWGLMEASSLPHCPQLQHHVAKYVIVYYSKS